LQNLLNLQGLPGLLLSLFAMIAGGWYLTRNLKSDAAKFAKEAQDSARSAMQEEINSLRRSMERVEQDNQKEIRALQKKNNRLEQTIDTICSALKSKGIIITISGEMIDMLIDSKKHTVIRIHNDDDDEKEGGAA